MILLPVQAESTNDSVSPWQLSPWKPGAQASQWSPVKPGLHTQLRVRGSGLQELSTVPAALHSQSAQRGGGAAVSRSLKCSERRGAPRKTGKQTEQEVKGLTDDLPGRFGLAVVVVVVGGIRGDG